MRIEDMIVQKFNINLKAGPPFCSVLGTRVTLAELFAEAHYNKGAEIGVQVGYYSEILLKANPDLKLLCVDAWHAYREYPRQHRQEEIYRQACERLGPYPGATIKRAFSVDAAREVPNKSLDFVYIDAEHAFDQVMLDLIHWVPKVRRRGIVSGHDFSIAEWLGVIPAVTAYMHAHGIGPLYVTDDARVRDLRRQLGRMPSWFWVQP